MSKDAIELTEEDKIALLNSLPVVDYSCSCGELEYVMVDLNEKTIDVLHHLGKDDQWIKDNSFDSDTVCIEEVGFEIADYYSTKYGFVTIDFMAKLINDQQAIITELVEALEKIKVHMVNTPAYNGRNGMLMEVVRTISKAKGENEC